VQSTSQIHPDPEISVPKDLLRLKLVKGANLSPDGTTLVGSLSWIDTIEDRSALFLLELSTGNQIQLTDGRYCDTNPVWSPSGEWIAYCSMENGNRQLFVMRPNGTDRRALTDLPCGVFGEPTWSPDSTHIAFVSSGLSVPRDPVTPFRVQRSVYRFTGIGDVEDGLRDVYIVSLGGAPLTRLTDLKGICSNPVWSLDGQRILFTSICTDDDPDSYWPTLRVVSLSDNQIATVITKWGRISTYTWLKDNRHILIVGASAKGYAAKSDLWRYDLEGEQTPDCRTVGLLTGVGCRLQPDMPIGDLLSGFIGVDRDDEKAYVNVETAGRLHVYEIALSGSPDWRPILEGDQSTILMDISADRKSLLCGISNLSNPLDLYILPVDGAKIDRLTTFNAALEVKFAAHPVTHFRVKTPADVDVDAWFMKPVSGEAPYPTILVLHGGPYGSFGHIFSYTFQLLADAGYGVLFTNHRGSAGYGDEFSKSIIGHWGEVGYADQMAVVDAAVQHGLADPAQLGVSGFSYGGFATCWIVGHTDRFKAAIAENASTNWVSWRGVADTGIDGTAIEFGVHQTQSSELYSADSPLTHAYHCTTPTLLIVSERDLRCPPVESEQFYAALRSVGCAAEMLRLPGVDHMGSFEGAPLIRAAKYQGLLEWFGRYLPINQI